MKIKYANNPNPKTILNCRYKIIEVSDNSLNGYISFIDITKASKVTYAPRYDGRKDKVFDVNYKWITLYPKNKNYAITAIYDENCTLVEFYIDIVDKIDVTRDGIPYMYDLFLDVVITYNNEIYVLDQDELYEALMNKDITPKQYDIANQTSKYIIENYSNKENFDKLKNFCKNYLDLFIKDKAK